MKTTSLFNMKNVTLTVLFVLFNFFGLQASAAEYPNDTIVYWGGKKRVHVAACVRYNSLSPEQKASTEEMTLAAARARGLDLCSKCPAKILSVKNADLPDSWVNPAPKEVLTYTFEPSPFKPLISMGPGGNLVYKSYSDKGDRVLDWSHCGYRQSEVPIPDVPVRKILWPLMGETSRDGTMAYPSGPDSRQVIQEALNKIAGLTSDANGLKGAVLLKAGTYYINGSLHVPSGVVLRGEGKDENGTTLILRSSSGSRNAIEFGEGGIEQLIDGAVRISGDYLPSGSYEISVTDASSFKPGDFVFVKKTVNKKWVDELGMGERLQHIRGGKEGLKKNPWQPKSYQFMHLRQIEKVNGNTILLDVMMPQSISKEHGGGEVFKADLTSLATHSGVESLRLVSNYDTSMEDTGKDANFMNFRTAISVSNAIDSWVRNVTVKHMQFAAVSIGDGSRQITVRDCKYLEPVGPNRGGFRYAYNIGGGTGHLVYNCYSEDARHDFAGGSRTMGPFAFVNSTAIRGGQSEPHHRWGTGFLFDNITTKDGSIAAINRGDSGTGHGWAAANTMIWNCDAPNIVVFDPETEGENNFAIGYSGDEKEGFDHKGIMYSNNRSGYWGTPQEGKFYGYALMGSGYIESPDAPVEPKSLFVQQLIDRIGREQAMRVLKDKEEENTILFEDPMTGDWRENWFLDGKKATLRNTKDGLFFSAGTVTKSDDPEEYHAHHAVLWTRKEFDGDIRISYELTRIDSSDYGTTLLYIQARGIGSPPYAEDISAWNDLREIPNMGIYFTYMDLLSLSFRENLRCKRYPWQDENLEWYPGKGLIEPMVDYGKILPGKTYLVEVEKKAVSLRLRMIEKESNKIMIDHSWNTDNIANGIEPKQIKKGRIGLRQMSTRQFIYRNFKLERL
ncbi:hypothetical protein [Cyclobacterium plantarum]|uniref:Uncharacterized protein n=1 Tax=Cyclobacterium plantarum TaxID=2716263 RepID=A0ABX0H985_9BACT|nr:hypothetical protein [Cyclobacterium plantarum]NHE56540.1 hypothetical protein [Cyclobacterium plantarum]